MGRGIRICVQITWMQYDSLIKYLQMHLQLCEKNGADMAQKNTIITSKDMTFFIVCLCFNLRASSPFSSSVLTLSGQSCSWLIVQYWTLFLFCHLQMFDMGHYQEKIRAYSMLSSHKNIAQIKDIVLGECKAYVFQEKDFGDMHTFVKSSKRLPEDLASKLFYQVVSAVNHCHQVGIVLGDLKLRKFTFSDEKRWELWLVCLCESVRKRELFWARQVRYCTSCINAVTSAAFYCVMMMVSVLVSFSFRFLTAICHIAGDWCCFPKY